MKKNLTRKLRRANLLKIGPGRDVVLGSLPLRMREAVQNLKSDRGFKTVQRDIEDEMFSKELVRRHNFSKTIMALSEIESTRDDGRTLHVAQQRVVQI